MAYEEFVAALGVQVILSTGAFGSQREFAEGKVTLTKAKMSVARRGSNAGISKALLVQTILAAEVCLRCVFNVEWG